MSIKVITIDFWNTMFDSSNGKERNDYRVQILRNQLSNYSESIDPAAYNKTMDSSWEYFNNIWLNEQRTPSALEVVEYVWKKMNLPPEVEIIDNVAIAFSDCLLRFRPKIIPGVKEALEELSKKFTLAIVSDTGFSPGSILKKLIHDESILKCFSAFSFSDETGVAKPHPKAFLTILEQMNCSPAESLHIGDIEKTDIIGAKKVGMHAIRFSGDHSAMFEINNPEKTQADFEVKSWKEILETIEHNFL